MPRSPTMLNTCQWFYECERCHKLLKPKADDWCVFCSYENVPCPPMQVQSNRANYCAND
nr:GDCCVxC domain-containing (seleno)protein [Noviherbaspirillum sp. UKPF54]